MMLSKALLFRRSQKTNCRNAVFVGRAPYGRTSSCSSPQRENNDEEKDESSFDSFRVLGVPRRFGLSPEELKQSYRRLMAEYHPDRHTDKPLPERERIDGIAARVTNAFQILKMPHTRATHLLELVGHRMEETSKSDLVGIEFLMQTMELRETVDSTKPENLKSLWDETQQRINQVLEELDESFEDNDFQKAIKLSAQLQYWHRIETAIYEKMEDDD